MRERGRNTALLRDERRGACLWSVFVESGESAASDAAAASNEQEWGVEYMSLAKTTVEIAEIQKASSGLSPLGSGCVGAWPAPTHFQVTERPLYRRHRHGFGLSF